MSLIAKLILSLVIAIIASTLTTLLLQGEMFSPQLLLAFFVATTATALIAGAGNTSAAPAGTSSTGKSTAGKASPAKPHRQAPANDGNRERGTVKWFNGSKGFGFIVKDDGEEIFVHFRSIRGEGRRSLSDGQRVTFIVSESDKGPQAEDVVDDN
jgi:CspA family cold shock protein